MTPVPPDSRLEEIDLRRLEDLVATTKNLDLATAHVHREDVMSIDRLLSSLRSALSENAELRRAAEQLQEVREDLAAMLRVVPPMRTPYLKGFHGRAVVTRAVAAIDKALSASTPSPKDADT